MNRLEHEDRIIELLRKDLPGVHVDSLPLGLSDRLALQVRTATAWVVYGGGQIKSPADHNVGQHIEYWHWTILILAAAYRSTREGVDAALPLLEAVNESLSWANFGGRALIHTGDAMLDLKEGCGLVGYESNFFIQSFMRRGKNA